MPDLDPENEKIEVRLSSDILRRINAIVAPYQRSKFLRAAIEGALLAVETALKNSPDKKP